MKPAPDPEDARPASERPEVSAEERPPAVETVPEGAPTPPGEPDAPKPSGNERYPRPLR